MSDVSDCPTNNPPDPPDLAAESLEGDTGSADTSDALIEPPADYFPEDVAEERIDDGVYAGVPDVPEDTASTTLSDADSDSEADISEDVEDSDQLTSAGPSLESSSDHDHAGGDKLGEDFDSAVRDRSPESDYFSDSDRVNDTLADFAPESWEGLSIDDKKQAIDRLADYDVDVLGIERKPTIEYYQGADPDEYGAYSGERNTLALNENRLADGPETADTVSHELRHAYQYQHAQDPQSDQDWQFADNFANYVSPEHDYAGYVDQMLERDAHEFAQRCRDHINT